MPALELKTVLMEDDLRLTVTLGTVPDEGLDTLWQLILAYPIKDADDTLRIDVGNRDVEGEGCDFVLVDELRARDGLSNIDKEVVGRGVDGVEGFEVDEDVGRSRGAAGVVGFEVHFGEVGAAAGLDIEEGGFIVVYVVVVVYGVEGLGVVGVVGRGGGRDVVVLVFGSAPSFV